MNFNYPIILASKSPRRQWLLKEAGFDFSIETKDTDEDFPADMNVYEVPGYLARKKALAMTEFLKGDTVLITADTVVIQKNQILGKPADAAEAKQMILQLSGARHEVVTGVCIKNQQKEVVFSDLTEVHFTTLSEEEIEWYIQKHQPFDKAGAYGAQEWIGMVAIEKLVGSYFNVMGLPVHKLYQELMKF